MRAAILALTLTAGLSAAGAAAAQDGAGQGAPERPNEGMVIYGPGQIGAEAETPSRIDSSRREMNRGRNGDVDPAPGGSAVRARAAAAVRRASLVCTVLEAAVVGRARGGEPLIEVDCAEGGGLIVADTDPVEVTDCLDLAPDAGPPVRGRRVIAACRLPGNVAAVRTDHSARN